MVVAVVVVDSTAVAAEAISPEAGATFQAAGVTWAPRAGGHSAALTRARPRLLFGAVLRSAGQVGRARDQMLPQDAE
jgi:hypothetical protein